MKIVKWISWEESEDLINSHGEDVEKLIESHIKEHLYPLSGWEHQYTDDGVPVFDDGTVFAASMRYWGGLVASAVSEIAGAILDYMDFAWMTGKECDEFRNEFNKEKL